MYSHPNWSFRNVKRATAIARTSDGVFSNGTSKEIAVVQPFGLNEFELPPEVPALEHLVTRAELHASCRV